MPPLARVDCSRFLAKLSYRLYTFLQRRSQCRTACAETADRQSPGNPIDVSKFNKAFALIGGKGPLEDAVRGLYGNNKVR